MRTTPLCLYPDPDNTTGGGNTKAKPRNATDSNAGHPTRNGDRGDGGQAEQANEDPDRPAGELRQDVMPDLGQTDGGTPNPT